MHHLSVITVKFRYLVPAVVGTGFRIAEPLPLRCQTVNDTGIFLLSGDHERSFQNRKIMSVNRAYIIDVEFREDTFIDHALLDVGFDIMDILNDLFSAFGRSDHIFDIVFKIFVGPGISQT